MITTTAAITIWQPYASLIAIGVKRYDAHERHARGGGGTVRRSQFGWGKYSEMPNLTNQDNRIQNIETEQSGLQWDCCPRGSIGKT